MTRARTKRKQGHCAICRVSPEVRAEIARAWEEHAAALQSLLEEYDARAIVRRVVNARGSRALS